MHRSVSILFLLLVACASASSQRPAGIAEPEVRVRLSESTFFGSTVRAHATVEVEVTNRANVPITVRRVEVDSPGMSQYRVVRTYRDVREDVAAGGSKVVSVMVPIETTTSRPTEPLSLRAIVDFEAGSDRWREFGRSN